MVSGIRKGSPSDSRLYGRLASLYEPIFTRLFRQRIAQAIQSLQIPPEARVLEVGVGTGMSLAAYPPHAQVFGIDLSEPMLQQARQKVQQHGWDHIRLEQMDAQQLEFPDNHFDFWTAFHVVSVVPDHGQLLREALRVTRPGGRLVIINHFRSQNRWLGRLVEGLDPLTRRLGWSTTLGLDDLQDLPLQIDRHYKTSRCSLFTVVMATKPTQEARQHHP